MRHQIAIRVGSTGTGDTTLLHAAAGLQQQPQQQHPMMDVTGLQENNPVSIATMMQQQQPIDATGLQQQQPMHVTGNGNANENTAGSNVSIGNIRNPYAKKPNGGENNNHALGSDAAQPQEQQPTGGRNGGNNNAVGSDAAHWSERGEQ